MDREIQYDAKAREELQRLALELAPTEFIKRLPEGIELVEPPFPGVSCEEYAVGTTGFRHCIAALYPKLDELAAGDFALYYDDDHGTVHVGRIQEDGLVVSKWGNDGPVLRHPVDMVPEDYGWFVFFRRIPEEKLQQLKGKSIRDLIK